MAENVDHGLLDAIENDKVEDGTAELQTITYWKL
jgi:hypothetical protein